MMIRINKFASFVVFMIAFVALVVAVLPGCSGGGSAPSCEVEDAVETEWDLERLDPNTPDPPTEQGGRRCDEAADEEEALEEGAP